MAQHKEKLVHYVKISVFCKAYESKEQVLSGLDILSPMPVQELMAQKKEYDNERLKTTFYRAKDIELTVQETESDDGIMTIYTLFFKRMHDTSEFAKKIAAAHNEQQKKMICEDPESVIDSEGNLKIRFEKRSLMNGKIEIADHGDCYLASAAIAAYPKTYEAVADVVKKIFG